MVGETGFEPATPASRRQCSTKLSYTPLMISLNQWNCPTDVTRFVKEVDVPFANNLAEQDLRMMKVKQKIFDGLRSDVMRAAKIIVVQ